MKKIILILATLGFSGFANSTTFNSEIAFLQNEFSRSRPYPIVIVDKVHVRNYLSRAGLLRKDSEEKAQAQALQEYFKSKVILTDNEATNLVPYFTVLLGSANAMPFFSGDLRNLRMTKCFVLPSGIELSHDEELLRGLGIVEGTPNSYSNQEVQSLLNRLSVENLRLFSLYHELSHCLDPQFNFPNGSHPSGQDIHRSETFAEVNALLLLYKYKNIRNIGYPRALMRALYTLRMGPQLAHAQAGMAGPTYNQGGTIYYLSPSILKAQDRMESFKSDVRKMSLDQIIKTSVELTQNHALSSRSFMALHQSILKGPEQGLATYEDMAIKDPDLFMGALVDVQSAWNFLNFLPKALAQ